MKKTKSVAAAAPEPKTKIAEAIEILAALGLPQAQRNDRSALALLALADIRPDSNWADAKPNLLRIHDILRFAHDAYGKSYAENSRETFRRQTIHQFEKGSLVERNPDDPERPTNSGKTVYRLTEDTRIVLASYGDASFATRVQAFLASHGSLQEAYARRREMNLVPVKLADGSTVKLSPGAHNRLQKAVIEEFAPRFAPHAVLLYLGDTAQKHVICDVKGLAAIGITLTEHDKLPDILLYREPERCLFLIEAVTSHGPVSHKRRAEMETILKDCPALPVFVTAFSTMKDMREHLMEIAWETEVWFADSPDHMIHYNGQKQLESRIRDHAARNPAKP